MTSESQTPRVLVVHSGARHNYALPAAFASKGMLEAFYTDACGGLGVGRLSSLFRHLPKAFLLSDALDRLARRTVPLDVLRRTRTFELEAIRYEVSRKLATNELGRFQALKDSNSRRSEIMRRWGLGRATHVFSVLGEGGDLLQAAHDRGLPILTDVIIALSTNRIIREEYQAHPDWGPPPAIAAGTLETDMGAVRHIFSTTDIFVCPSAFVAEDLIGNWGVRREATRIVPYALSESWFSLKAEPRRGRVLFVGSADRRKGIHYLAKAANILRGRGRNYEFRVAGGVDRQVKEHEDAASLQFLGRVPRSEIAAEFASADIFVLPTLAEGSATVIYEALASGLPVVTTMAAGSVARDGEEGRIVPERDPHALADAIEAIVEDRALRSRFSQSAKDRAQSFTWEKYAHAIRELVAETPTRVTPAPAIDRSPVH
jgi:glycosyltransferase involved in cell wall biosynthesis